jgi:hypothetical protein
MVGEVVKEGGHIRRRIWDLPSKQLVEWEEIEHLFWHGAAYEVTFPTSVAW